VADDDWLALQLADDRRLVVGDLADALSCEHLRVFLCFGDRLRIVGPAGRHGDVASLLK